MGGAVDTPRIAQEVAPARDNSAWNRGVAWLRGDGWTLTASRRVAVVLGLTIPLSTSATEIVLVVLLVWWLISGDFAAKARAIYRNRVVVLALALFAVLAVAMSYTSAVEWSHATASLAKYRKLLYVPVFATILVDPQTRRRCIWAFQIAMGITLAASLLMRFGLLTSVWGDATDCAFFKNHIAQNFLMVLFVAVTVYQLRLDRRLWGLRVALILFAVYNILFMVAGRTGHVILFALVCLLMVQWKGIRGLAYGAAIVACLALAAFHASDAFRDRADKTIFEAYAYFRFGDDSPNSSIGRRLAFYRTSVTLARRHPLLGTGTGSFAAEFNRLPENQEYPADPTLTPHSGYFSVMVQTGGLGLAILLAWIVVQWRSCRRLPPELVLSAQAVVVTFAVGNLFNSLLSSTTEGWIFCYLAAGCFASLGTTTPESNATEPPVESRPKALAA